MMKKWIKRMITELLEEKDTVEQIAEHISDKVTDACVASVSAEDVAYEMDCSEVAEHISTSDIASDLAYDIDAGEVAENISLDDLASYLDNDAIADYLDKADVADHIYLPDLASEIDIFNLGENIDPSDIEVDLSDVAGCLDMSELSEYTADHINYESVVGAMDDTALYNQLRDAFETDIEQLHIELDKKIKSLIHCFESIELAVTDMRLTLGSEEE